LQREDDARARADPILAVVHDDPRVIGDTELLQPRTQILGRGHLQHQTGLGVLGNRDIVERHQACAGKVAGCVFVRVTDVQQHDVGILDVRGEPFGVDDHVAARIAGRGGAGDRKCEQKARDDER